MASTTRLWLFLAYLHHKITFVALSTSGLKIDFHLVVMITEVGCLDWPCRHRFAQVDEPLKG